MHSKKNSSKKNCLPKRKSNCGGWSINKVEAKNQET